MAITENIKKTLIERQEKISTILAKDGFLPEEGTFRDHSIYLGNIGQSLSVEYIKNEPFTTLSKLNLIIEKLFDTQLNPEARFHFSTSQGCAYNQGKFDCEKSGIMVQVYTDDCGSEFTKFAQCKNYDRSEDIILGFQHHSLFDL